MNRKQRIIVSVTGIFLVLLILLGLTYAYFLTKINGNPNDKSLSVTMASLLLKYEDGNGLVALENIMPGDEIPSKTFTVTNKGNSKVNGYAVYIENLINQFTITKDLTYTLDCKSSVKNKSCAGKGEETFPTVNGILTTNSIEVDETQTYTLKVKYKETGTDQSIDMNKIVSGKIQIYALEEIVDLTGTVTGVSEGDYVELHSTPKRSEIKDGKYLIPAVEPGNHILYIKDKDGNILGQSGINIERASTPTFTEDSIKVTADSQKVTIDIEKTTTKLNLEYKLIEKYNPYSDNKNSLAYKIIDNAQTIKQDETQETNRTKWGTEVTSFTSISGENERVLNTIPDDYGTSYYYRGNVLDNYVSFAGFTWRIVRINGDGSVRLIFEEKAGNVAFNSKYDDNAYIGYMYGLAGSTTDENRCLILVDNEVTNKIDEYTTKETCEVNNGTWTTTAYDATHSNIKNSTIKEGTDSWYKTNIEEKGYSKYVADTLFCNDKKKYAYGNGTGQKITYYRAYGKFAGWYTVFKPDLKCSLGESNDYSRFTVNKNLISSDLTTNGKLTYPVGLLTADEAVFAGTHNKGKNTNYLDYKKGHFWLLTGGGFTEFSRSETSKHFGAENYIISVNGGGLSNFALFHNNAYIKPVINLKKDLKFTGTGTSTDMYKIVE